MADQIVKPAVLAVIFGVTERRLRQYVGEGMPHQGREGYPLAGSVQWMIDYWRKRAQQTPLGEARRRKVEADAANAEIELELKRGNVIDIRTVARAHGAACARIRTRLRAIPSKLAPRVHRLRTVAEVEAELRREIDEGLEELADAAERTAAARAA